VLQVVAGRPVVALGGVEAVTEAAEDVRLDRGADALQGVLGAPAGAGVWFGLCVVSA
jgi:hypothetical protein